MAAALAPGDASRRLWRDVSIFPARYEKAATALIAVQRTLERHRDLCPGVGEFLDLYPRLADASSDVFTSVWKDPYAYYWLRIAFELTGAALRGQPIPRAAGAYAGDFGRTDAASLLGDHLQEFKKLVLGVCALEGSSVAFRSPLRVDLPCAIPGTRWSALGDGIVEVHGSRDGEPRWAAGSRARLEECPSVASDGVEIWLQPHAFRQRGLRAYEPDGSPGFEGQRLRAPVFEQALRVLQRFAPDAFTQLGQAIRMVSLQQWSDEDYTNYSHSDLPGTILVGFVPNALFLGDALVHELHHHRLFFLEEAGPILAGTLDETIGDERFLSPWRGDLRPLHGLLHGAYVFVPICRYWLRILETGELDGPERAMALFRGVGGIAQLRVGLHQLRTHARFTSDGAALFTQLESDFEGLAAEYARAGLPADPEAVCCYVDGRIEVLDHPTERRKLTTLEQLATHVRRFAPPDQADDILRHALPAG